MCGPESPNAMGRGGRTIAAARKQTTQRPGAATIHQANGMRKAGAARISLSAGVGAKAIAAAQAPIAAAAGRRVRTSGYEAPAMLIAMRQSVQNPLLLEVHFECEPDERKKQTQQQSCGDIQWQIR